MRIATPNIKVNRSSLIEGLQNIAFNSLDYDRRPCLSCDFACECSKSKTCACCCHHQCPLAPKFLSEDPIRYPIERRIVPLVMEFQYIEGIQTCWSCEGHENARGELIKLPRIWFYVADLVYLPVLQRYIDVTTALGRLNCDWQIKRIELGNRYPDCYSIEPIESNGEIFSLYQDCAQLARGAGGIIRAIAEQWLRDLR